MHRNLYDVSKWHVLQHRWARGLPSPRLYDNKFVAFHDEVFDRVFSTEPEMMPPEAISNDAKDWALKMHQALEASPEFDRLSDSVRGDAFLSALATESICRVLQVPTDDPEKGNGKGRGKQDGDSNGGGNGQTPAPPNPEDIKKAVEHAEKEVQEAQDMKDAMDDVEGFGVGRGAGKKGGINPLSDENVSPIKKAYEKIRGDHRIMQIAKLAGRLRRIAANVRRSRVKHGSDELQDIELGGEIQRLIPSELVKFVNPALKMALLRDIVEKKAMQYRLDGTDTQGMGPIIVLLDKSGSMGDYPHYRDHWATAVALALYERAKIEKRPMLVLPFNGCVIDEFEIRPGQQFPETLLQMRPGGGTNFIAPLSKAADFIEKEMQTGGKFKTADIVLITDGDSNGWPGQIKPRLEKLGAKILGLGIGVPESRLTENRGLAPEVSGWCHEARSISDLTSIDQQSAEKLFE